MTEEIKVPRDLWDNLNAFFTGKKPDQPNIPEEYKVAMRERDELKAKQVELQQKAEQKAKVEKLTAQLQDKERFGAMFADAKFAGEAAEMFSSLNDKQAEWFMRKFAALQGQIDFSQIGKEFGETGTTHASDPVQEFSAMVAAKQKEKGFEQYGTALRAVRDANPEFATAYDLEMKKRAKE